MKMRQRHRQRYFQWRQAQWLNDAEDNWNWKFDRPAHPSLSLLLLHPDDNASLHLDYEIEQNLKVTVKGKFGTVHCSAMAISVAISFKAL